LKTVDLIAYVQRQTPFKKEKIAWLFRECKARNQTLHLVIEDSWGAETNLPIFERLGYMVPIRGIIFIDKGSINFIRI
jgi:hypothetical protein